MWGRSLRFLSESLGTGSVTTKPKRRAYLLKRKALTTGFFDNKGKDEKEKGNYKAPISIICAIGYSSASLSHWNDQRSRINGDVIHIVSCICLFQLKVSSRTNELQIPQILFDIFVQFIYKIISQRQWIAVIRSRWEWPNVSSQNVIPGQRACSIVSMRILIFTIYKRNL